MNEPVKTRVLLTLRVALVFAAAFAAGVLLAWTLEPGRDSVEGPRMERAADPILT